MVMRMRIEKKLVACSILCLIVGISSVSPLLFLMPARAETTDSTPWFNVSVPYAYWATSNLTLPSTQLENGTVVSTANDPYGREAPLLTLNEKHAIILNFTLNPTAIDDHADARIEYYLLTIYSDKGPIANMSYFIGTSNTNDFDKGKAKWGFALNDWFDSSGSNPQFDGSTFSAGSFFGDISQMKSGEPQILPISGSSSGSEGDNGTANLVSALRQAQVLYIDVSRQGWVTYHNNTAQVTLGSNEVLQHIQLDRYGEEGFLYNNFFAPEELLQINLASPLGAIPTKP